MNLTRGIGFASRTRVQEGGREELKRKKQKQNQGYYHLKFIRGKYRRKSSDSGLHKKFIR